MTQTQHTPTPWEICGLKKEGLAIRAVGCTSIIAWTNNSAGSGYTKDFERDAAFIVKAVNCHDELVEACEHALKEFEAYEAPQIPDDPTFAVVQVIKAALAKAKAGAA